PVVVLNRRVAGLDSVTPDFGHGMGQALTHLAENGIRTVTYVAGPVNSWSDGERWRAARVAARQHGLQIQRHGPFAPTTAGGEQAFEELRDSLPHAVVCYNDLVAFGFLISALRAGIRVPGELSVMGHDDIQLSRLVGGGLTTLVSPKRAQGRAAVERLVRRSEDPSAPRTPGEGTLPVRLVPRGPPGPRSAGRWSPPHRQPVTTCGIRRGALRGWRHEQRRLRAAPRPSPSRRSHRPRDRPRTLRAREGPADRLAPRARRPPAAARRRALPRPDLAVHHARPLRQPPDARPRRGPRGSRRGPGPAGRGRLPQGLAPAGRALARLCRHAVPLLDGARVPRGLRPGDRAEPAH